MFEVYDNKLLIARGGGLTDILPGNNFYSKPEEWLQFGSFWYEKGKIIQSHLHKPRNRQGKHRTCEFFYVVSGCLRINFYTSEKMFLQSRWLFAEDFACCYNGGHGFSVEAENTKVLEIKHGKFTSPEDDKERF